jgi:hypothetical protein
MDHHLKLQLSVMIPVLNPKKKDHIMILGT